MTQTYYPLANSPVINANQWSKMAQNWLATGIIRGALNELQVFADSTGMQVKVKSGQAWLKGHFFESDTEAILAIGTADTTNPRIDRVIVRLDWVANSIQLSVLQGVAAATPTAPALTQNDARWEISLAQIAVGANVSTITAGNVTEERSFVKNFNSEAIAIFTNLTLQNGATVFQTRTPRYFKIGSEIIVEGEINNIAAGTTIGTLPTGHRPPDLRIFKTAMNSGVSNDGATVYINTDGTIVVQAVANGTNSISLMGISFYIN